MVVTVPTLGNVHAGYVSTADTDPLMVVSVWFFIVREWFTVCVHTLDLGFESHPEDSDSVYKGPHMYSRPARIRTSNPVCKPKIQDDTQD